MLSYLLGENILFVVAEQLARKNPQIGVQSVYHWRNRAFGGQEELTLVTYDLSTIPPLLAEMAAEGEAHAGVLFVDDASIRSNDFGGLVTALLAHR